MKINFKTPEKISLIEFIFLLAFLMSLSALSIDAMLPALGNIGEDLGVKSANETQYAISFIFIGMAVGQIFYGPFSDSKGRKISIFISLSIFIIGCVISMFAQNFDMMLFGRFLQGLGASGPKVVLVAMVRDVYKGREMAKVMSFVMIIFIFAPAIAPSIGEVILRNSSWNTIFFIFIILSFISMFWLGVRQKETLKKENRKLLKYEILKKDILEILCNKTVVSYTLAMGIIQGMFMAYLSTAQQILQIQYSLGDKFALYFAINAFSIGLAAIFNSKAVMKLGMRYLSSRAIIIFTLLTIIYFPISLYFSGHPPLWTFILYCILSFFNIGILFGNLNALAMEPMGHIAGTAAAVIGSLSTFISLPIGILIGQLYDNTLLPMLACYIFFGALSMYILLNKNKD